MDEIHLEENLIAILDKITEIKRSMLWEISETYGLTPLQIQILLLIKRCAQYKKINPTDIVKELYVSKATASSAVKTLLKKEMIEKNINNNDNRSFYVSLTKKAGFIITHIEQTTHTMQRYLTQIDKNDKRVAFGVLIRMVKAMQDDGAIDYIALCINCEYCKQLSGNTFMCSFTKRTFKYDGINIGCCNFTDKKII